MTLLRSLREKLFSVGIKVEPPGGQVDSAALAPAGPDLLPWRAQAPSRFKSLFCS